MGSRATQDPHTEGTNLHGQSARHFFLECFLLEINHAQETPRA